MKETIKIFLFIEIITIMVCGLMHISAVIIGEKFPLKIYLILMGITLFTFLFTFLIVQPLSKWFFD